ncbi:type I pantothenate kinase [Facklamia sp. 7083-14-GEN3]|uniref:type I pantothenate kinase n=1 Tax=Facklamia sp. 7083-14-GEN3 TaxID=2973478 RepID=UPI00215BEDF2|nr:type I pantothenate kinase [Facklamia sp. 7083-14-GEN3]MCR8969776.1 type I pantothenate kinase [Facklamia sp. 7083-14-GEN3]
MYFAIDDYYASYNRKEWQAFQSDDLEILPIDQLASLVSIQDRLTQTDVKEIYGPLLHYIEADFQHTVQYNMAKQRFFTMGDCNQEAYRKVPFIIGISGSVAVGKSTTARLLHQLLKETFPKRQVDLITTDGFLYPNEVLEQRGMLKRKGFPESYDMSLLIEFMTHIKTQTSPFSVPTYSHLVYDIVKGDYQIIKNPDILIVEGINVLQLPTNQQIYVSDFFDFSIYIDADKELIHKWFVNRFLVHLQMAKNAPTNYYHKMSSMSEEEAIAYADNVWFTINLPNLIQHIKPTRSRADVVLHKSENHYIDYIHVKKY